MIDRQKSNQILESLSAIWAQSRSDYRDSRIRCGRLIREYISQRLREVEDLPEYRRGISRQGAIEEVQSRLGIRKALANELIRVSAVVDLFWGQNPLPATVSYSTLRPFQTLVRRPNGKARRTTKVADGTISLSEKESWHPKKEYAVESARIFKSMVANYWNSKRVIGEIQKIKPTRDQDQSWRAKTHGECTRPDLFSIARNSSPHDLADMILTLVENSSSPETVLQIVLKGQRV